MIVIKKEYKNILEKLGVLEQYKANVIKYCEGENITVNAHMTVANSWVSFGSFIRNSFIWDYTPEHHEFWKNITKKGGKL